MKRKLVKYQKVSKYYENDCSNLGIVSDRKFLSEEKDL